MSIGCCSASGRARSNFELGDDRARREHEPSRACERASSREWSPRPSTSLIVFVLLLLALGGYAVVDYLFTDDPLEYPGPRGRVEQRGLQCAARGGAHAGLVGFRTHPRQRRHRAPRAHRIGEPAHLAARRCSARSIVVYVPVISMLWILVSRKNAGLHDLVCRTAVIYDWGARPVTQCRPPE